MRPVYFFTMLSQLVDTGEGEPMAIAMAMATKPTILIWPR